MVPFGRLQVPSCGFLEPASLEAVLSSLGQREIADVLTVDDVLFMIISVRICPSRPELDTLLQVCCIARLLNVCLLGYLIGQLTEDLGEYYTVGL